MNTARKTFFSLTVGLCVLTTLKIPLLEPLAAQKTESQWQNSFALFIDEVSQWQGQKPGVTMQTFLEGQVVPSDEWEIMKKYGAKNVRWTAAFDGIDKPSDKHPKQGSRVKLKMDMGGKAGTVIAYSAAGAEPAWQPHIVGAQVQFEGRIVGIQFDYLPIRGGVTGYWITIFNCKPLGSAQSAQADRSAFVETATVKTADGRIIEGAIAGTVAIDNGVGCTLVAGEDIQRIDEHGVHIRVGASVLSALLGMMTNYEVFKDPPHALLLEHAVQHAPSSPGMAPANFEIGDKHVALTVLLGNQKDPGRAQATRILGEFRIKDGKGSIVPALTIKDAQGKTLTLPVSRIAPFQSVDKNH